MEEGIQINEIDLDIEQKKIIKNFNFLTNKPFIIGNILKINNKKLSKKVDFIYNRIFVFFDEFTKSRIYFFYT